jgi:hypothetical protein
MEAQFFLCEFRTERVMYIDVSLKKFIGLIFRWFIPVVCDYNISIDKVGNSKTQQIFIKI